MDVYNFCWLLMINKIKARLVPTMCVLSQFVNHSIYTYKYLLAVSSYLKMIEHELRMYEMWKKHNFDHNNFQMQNQTKKQFKSFMKTIKLGLWIKKPNRSLHSRHMLFYRDLLEMLKNVKKWHFGMSDKLKCESFSRNFE